MKRKLLGGGKKQLFTKRFFPAGNYTWVVPPGCTEVDVFLVGSGGGGNSGSGGGGGYTKTFKKDTTGWRDGDAIKVTPGQSIPIIVGTGVNRVYGGYAINGNNSQFLNSNYRAPGGNGAGNGIQSESGYAGGYIGGNGGSGGAPDDRGIGKPGSDGSNGLGSQPAGSSLTGTPGRGQGHTTRDFGEADGRRNAGGGAADRGASIIGGTSDYIEGSGTTSAGGGGYGGGGAGHNHNGRSGDGTVLIRYWAYTE